MATAIIGAAGEHYVAFQLLARGYTAALTPKNSNGVDILACNRDGSGQVAIQVKTADNAERYTGTHRTGSLCELDFPLKRKYAEPRGSENLIFAFVDLHNKQDDNKDPDVYVVPSEFVHAHCEEWVAANGFTTKIRNEYLNQFTDQFKNNWKLIEDKLKASATS